jgi:hypothetical protein
MSWSRQNGFKIPQTLLLSIMRQSSQLDRIFMRLRRDTSEEEKTIGKVLHQTCWQLWNMKLKAIPRGNLDLGNFDAQLF